MSYRAFRFEWGSSDYNTPNKFVLNQNYPNPFNTYTTIKFDIPVSSNTNLSVYDITGRKVDVIINKFMQKGSYSQS
jgi:hypothetical protein